jgi:hypothetical protein
MNRHGRRVAARRKRALNVPINQIDELCDIQVDAKPGQVVMIMANATGRKRVEQLWPDVEWSTDEIFSVAHSPDWLFTHVRVTKLPSNFEAKVPLAFATPDSLGFAVALALQHRYAPRRVLHWTGDGLDVKVNFYDGTSISGKEVFVEYVPAGTVLGAPQSVN